jgi:formylglycine-generating enzyme required for sulfatase activity
MAADSPTLHRFKRKNKAYCQVLPGGADLWLMLIPAGEFMMGAPKDEPDSSIRERPQHQVQVSPFLMGQPPVTQAQWRSVVENIAKVDRDLTPNPSSFKGDNCPVERVSWEDAVEFCNRLSQLTGMHYKLPSEAQWEYACRAGTETAYHYGAQLTEELANYNDKIRRTTDVKSYPANRWGLYDMHGNVLEWCEDDWHSYTEDPTDDSAWLDLDINKDKLLRGGAWGNSPGSCRSAYRNDYSREVRDVIIGFRVCCVPPRTGS